jgi:hypothetical protein
MTTLRQFLLFCLSTLLVALPLMTQDVMAFGTVKARRPVRCPACQLLTQNYNALRDELADKSYDIDRLDAMHSHTEDQLTNSETKLKNLKAQFIKTPTERLSSDIKTEENYHSTLRKKFGKEEREISAEQQDFQTIARKVDFAEENLNACEAKLCHLSFMHPATQLFYMSYIHRVALSMMVGNMTNSQTGYLYTPSERFKGSNSQNNALLNLQARFLFGAPEYMHPFIMMNLIRMFNSNNRLLSKRTDGFSNYNSSVTMRTLWLAHVLIGLQTAMLFNNWNFSAGVGGGAVNQQLKTSVGETGITSKNSTQTSLVPSWMLGLDYKLCRHCIGGFDLSLTGQLTGDRYPNTDNTVKTPFNNSYKGKASEAWQYAEMLGLTLEF